MIYEIQNYGNYVEAFIPNSWDIGISKEELFSEICIFMHNCLKDDPLEEVNQMLPLTWLAKLHFFDVQRGRVKLIDAPLDDIKKLQEVFSIKEVIDSEEYFPLTTVQFIDGSTNEFYSTKELSAFGVPTDTIKVTDVNRKYIVSQLTTGDYVKFTMSNGTIIGGKTIEARVNHLVYDFISQLPLIDYRESSHEEDFPTACHSIWLTEVVFGNGIRNTNYFPSHPLCPLYNYSHPIEKVLFNEYGHRPQWTDTLYDIGKIHAFLVDNGIDLTKTKVTYKKKKLKSLVLAAAAKFKVKRIDHNIQWVKENNELHDDIDYD